MYEPISRPSIRPCYGQRIDPQIRAASTDVPRAVCVTSHRFTYIDSREFRGVILEFLPPYSPDLNPIEEAFSAIKHYLRRHRDIVENEFSAEPRHRATDVLLDAVFTVTEHQSHGWFRHSGYI